MMRNSSALMIAMAIASVSISTDSAQAEKNWRELANQRIAALRQGDFIVKLKDASGKPLILAQPARIRQVGAHFYFGTCFSGDALSEDPTEKRYRQFILEHFNTLVSENDMKWYRNQPQPGPVTYDVAERMMTWAARHKLAVRGHCILWEKREFNPSWVRELAGQSLRQAIENRIDSVVPQFKGRLIAWDVNNEMLDGKFYTEQLSEEFRAEIFKRVAMRDPLTPLFLNDYSILGERSRTRALLAQVAWFRQRGCKIDGLGIQEHGCERFVDPESSSRDIYETLDELSTTGLPIHLTEISSRTRDHQLRADGLEVLIRTAFSHPGVQAILVWGFWSKRHWFKEEAALVDDDWKLTPAGQRLGQMLLEEWRTQTQAAIDEEGRLRFRGFFGTYEIHFLTSTGSHMVVLSLTPEQLQAEVEIP
jgi:GH35 family endo-1,4-beta-xylanase